MEEQVVIPCVTWDALVGNCSPSDMEGCNLTNYEHAEARLATLRVREEQAASHQKRDAIGKDKRTLWNVSRELSVTLAEIASYKRVPKRLLEERERLEAKMLELLQIVEAGTDSI